MKNSHRKMYVKEVRDQTHSHSYDYLHNTPADKGDSKSLYEACRWRCCKRIFACSAITLAITHFTQLIFDSVARANGKLAAYFRFALG